MDGYKTNGEPWTKHRWQRERRSNIPLESVWTQTAGLHHYGHYDYHKNGHEMEEAVEED